jgi:hypothetical protein
MIYRIIFGVLFLPVLVSAQPTVRGLVASYKCDGNAMDASGNGNNGSLTGGVTTTSDRWGNRCGALHFDGKDAYITIPDSKTLHAITDAITVTAWFKMAHTADKTKWLSLLCKGKNPAEAPNNPQYRFQFQSSARSTLSIDKASAKIPYAIGKELPDSTWSFIAMVYDRMTLRVYLNDTMIFTWPFDEPFIANMSPLYIGHDVPGHNKFFNGSLDDIRIYNVPLSFSEIKAIYHDGSGDIKKDLLSDCPGDIEKPNDAGKCGAKVDFPTPMLRSDCGAEYLRQVSGPVTGSFFYVGISTVTFAARDQMDSHKCSFNVTVKDIDTPHINCPDNIYVTLSSGQTDTVIKYEEPTVTDNCPIAVKLVKGKASGSKFSAGSSEITYQATDKGGYTTECSFTVNVSANPADRQAAPVKKTIYGDTIRIRNNETISDCSVTMFVADDGYEDGDTVSIFFNGEEIVKQERLRVNHGNSYEHIIGVHLDLDPDRPNIIIIKAWNVGESAPNTSEVRIFEGNLLDNLPSVKTKKYLLKKRFACYPGLTDGMTLNCSGGK